MVCPGEACLHKLTKHFLVVVAVVQIALIAAFSAILLPLHGASYTVTPGVIESVTCEAGVKGNSQLGLTLEGETYAASVNAYECSEMRRYFRNRYVEIKHSPGGTRIVDVTYWDEDRFSESKRVVGSYILCLVIFICANFWLFSFYRNKLRLEIS